MQILHDVAEGHPPLEHRLEKTGKAVVPQNDLSRIFRDLRGRRERNTDIRRMKRRRVVNAIAEVPHHMTTRLERQDDATLQDGRNPCENVPERVDGAILFAPAGELVPPALRALDRGGILSIAGIHPSDVPSINYEKELFYERVVRSVTANTRADGRTLFAEAVEAKVRPQVTAYALEEANQALLDLKKDRIAGTGVLRMGD